MFNGIDGDLFAALGNEKAGSRPLFHYIHITYIISEWLGQKQFRRVCCLKRHSFRHNNKHKHYNTGEYWYSARQLTSCLKALGGTITLGIAQGGMLTISTQDAYYLQNVMRAPAAKKKVTKAAKPSAAKAA